MTAPYRIVLVPLQIDRNPALFWFRPDRWRLWPAVQTTTCQKCRRLLQRRCAQTPTHPQNRLTSKWVKRVKNTNYSDLFCLSTLLLNVPKRIALFWAVRSRAHLANRSKQFLKSTANELHHLQQQCYQPTTIFSTLAMTFGWNGTKRDQCHGRVRTNVMSLRFDNSRLEQHWNQLLVSIIGRWVTSGAIQIVGGFVFDVVGDGEPVALQQTDTEKTNQNNMQRFN